MTYASKPGAPGGGQGSPVHVTLPGSTPNRSRAVRGARARRAVCRRTGDLSGVSDCNVNIRHHPHVGEQDVR
ncbi:hypothetical protein ACFWJQ_18485 [Streptomyces goshikiensis]|uniref:hypothetical protein n=1 Tax=Streptomyces goshikiensis TaxID=1942 RepID=UPI0036460573